MRVTQFIDFSDQITGSSVPAARQSSLVESMRYAVMTSLFSQRKGPEQINLDFEACLARFQLEMAFSDKLGPGTQAMLQALDLTDAASEQSRTEAYTAAYIASLHLISRAVALFTFNSRLRLESDSHSEAAESSRASLPGPSMMDAVIPVKDWLLYRTRKYRKQIPADSELAFGKAARALAKAMTRCAILSMTGHKAAAQAIAQPIEIRQSRSRAANGKPITVDCIVAGSKLSAAMVNVLRRAPHVLTLQPLLNPPRYLTSDASYTRRDPDRTTARPLIDWRISTPFLRSFAEECHKPDYLSEMIKAVNAQQAVRWRVNRPLSQWVRVMAWLDTIAGAPDKKPLWLTEVEEPLMQAVDSLRVWPPEDLQIARLLAVNESEALGPDSPVLLTQKNNKPSPASKHRNPLDNPLVSSVLDTLGQRDVAADSDPDGAAGSFYLAWKADYRGRIYTDTPWFTPQGADLQRSLLEFAQGQQLTDAGRRALKRHGASMVRRGLLLNSLEIKDRKVVTHGERERWVDEHETQILDSARNPLRNLFWRDASSDPLQFLAFCIEWQRQHDNPQALCHLPIKIDASCNGLQHMAALTGSEPLALAVNVKQRSDGLPGDIYTELADIVGAALADGTAERTIKSKPPNAQARNIMKVAYEFLATHADWAARSTAKKVVMTVPYGAGQASQAQFVYENLLDSRCPLPAQDELALKKLGELVFESINKDRPPKTDDVLVQLGLKRVAFCIARELRHALKIRYPAAAKFQRAVESTGKAVLQNRGPDAAVRMRGSGADRRMPLAWLAPSGLAVCQPGFKTRRASASVTLRNKQRIDIGFTEYLPQVDASKQANSLMPNLIHSLDATHLFRSLVAIRKRGVQSFGSIHDCIQCLPNDLPVVEEELRLQFSELYAPAEAAQSKHVAPQVLVDWHEWMQLLNDIVRVPSPKALRAGVAQRSSAANTVFAQAVNTVRDGIATGAGISGDLIARIRQLPAAQRAIATCLIEVLADEARPEADGMIAQKKLLPISAFSAQDEARLDVAEVLQSTYFFS